MPPHLLKRYLCCTPWKFSVHIRVLYMQIVHLSLNTLFWVSISWIWYDKSLTHIGTYQDPVIAEKILEPLFLMWFLRFFSYTALSSVIFLPYSVHNTSIGFSFFLKVMHFTFRKGGSLAGFSACEQNRNSNATTTLDDRFTNMSYTQR